MHISQFMTEVKQKWNKLRKVEGRIKRDVEIYEIISIKLYQTSAEALAMG